MNDNRINNGNLELHYCMRDWTEIAARHHYDVEDQEIFSSQLISALQLTLTDIKCYVWQETFLNAFMEIYENQLGCYECQESEADDIELVETNVRIEQLPGEIVVRIPLAELFHMFIEFGKRSGYTVCITDPDELVEVILSELENPSYGFVYASCSEVMIVFAIQYLKSLRGNGSMNNTRTSAYLLMQGIFIK